jgi:hypothetical protein
MMGPIDDDPGRPKVADEVSHVSPSLFWLCLIDLL